MLMAPARSHSGLLVRVSLFRNPAGFLGGPGLWAIPPVLLDKDATSCIRVSENTLLLGNLVNRGNGRPYGHKHFSQVWASLQGG